jgi:hypothetical protein
MRKQKIGINPRQDMIRAIELIADLRERILNPFAPVKWTLQHERELRTLAGAYDLLDKDTGDPCATSEQNADPPQESA